MSKILTSLVISLLVASAFAQTVNLSAVFTPATQATLGPEYQDPEFLKLINNYFGCKTWQNGACTECSASYIFNKNGVCCLIDSHCQNFNRDMGVCELCYTGYSVSANGSCSQVSLSSSDETVGCAEWKNNVCSKCSSKYFLYTAPDSTKSFCKPVSDDCREWKTETGECTSCYHGYALSNQACNLDNTPPSTVTNNPHCKTWNGSECTQCASRAYFDANRICQLVNSQCWTWDSQDGLCLTCYKGYDLQKGSCVYSPSNTAAVSDPGCKSWSGETCVECSTRWVFNDQGFCIPVSDSCRTNDEKGVCLTCYAGYILVNGGCEYDAEGDKISDPGCGKWSWNNKTCSSCSEGWVFNDNGNCVAVKDSCRTHDSKGLCTGCYRGYDLQNDGTCLLSNNYQTTQDKGCKLWNWETNLCSECSAWWVLNATSGTCVQVNTLCKTYTSSGACESCYKGYDLTNDVCTVSPIAAPSDLGCKIWKESVCVECSSNWVFNHKLACVAVSDQCKTHDADGNCLSCYVGYGVVNGSCLFVTETVSDAGCKEWDWTNKVCKACSAKYVVNSNGLCVSVSDQCRTHDDAGFCTSCYRGYVLVSTLNQDSVVTAVTCELPVSNHAPPSDLGCKIWNWDNDTCLECSFGWFFNSEHHCAQISPYCKSSDLSNGQCLSCYLGYDLANGTCTNSPSNTAPPSDLGCKTWKDGVCTECSHNWEFNDKKVCTPVSDLCKTHEGNLCTSCFNGYVLVNGTCQLSPLNSVIPTDAGCKNWDWNAQRCLECAPFWVFSSGGVCSPVSDLCKTYDNSTGVCLSCFKGYSLNNGSCVAQENAVSDAGCGTWDWDSNKCVKCSNYWYFNAEGVCSAVSPYCKTYDPATGACTSCFSSYALSNGVCSLSVTLCKTSDDSGCLSCYEGFALYQKKCISLDNIANIALYYAECCPQKLAKLQAEGRIPK